RIFQFWLGLRQNHPELTLEAAGELLRQAGEEREANATNTPPGNSPGQTQDRPPAVATAAKTRPSRGGASSGN
ncbi:MAG: hypothetical protein ACYC35_05200, partial [Pirellulales bacterium]